jgi:hypothetical protein
VRGLVGRLEYRSRLARSNDETVVESNKPKFPGHKMGEKIKKIKNDRLEGKSREEERPEEIVTSTARQARSWPGEVAEWMREGGRE